MDLLNRAIVRREYNDLLARHNLDPADPAPLATGEARRAAMRHAIALLWSIGKDTTISWIGFYENAPGSAGAGGEPTEMVLVCREPKPACSPISLHGLCGRGMLNKAAYIAPDIRTLGENYIACDPKDQSELVIPVLDAAGNCDAVLDVDSYDLNAFDEHDAQGMTKVMVALGITSPRTLELKPVRV